MQKFMRWSICVSIVLIFVKKLWENEWSCITSFIYLHYYKIVKRPCRYIEHIFKDPLGTYCMLVSEPKYVFRIFVFVYFLVSSPTRKLLNEFKHRFLYSKASAQFKNWNIVYYDRLNRATNTTWLLSSKGGCEVIKKIYFSFCILDAIDLEFGKNIHHEQ